MVLSEKWWSRTSPFLEDILYEVPEISGGSSWLGSSSFNWILSEVNVKNVHQEPPPTWRTSLIFLRFLRFLMGILMVGVIFIQLDFVQGFQKCIILGVLCEKCPRTSPYLEDVFDLLEVLKFLMGILIVGVIYIQLDFIQGF